MRLCVLTGVDHANGVRGIVQTWNVESRPEHRNLEIDLSGKLTLISTTLGRPPGRARVLDLLMWS